MNARSAGLAAGLKDSLGIPRRRCVGICLENGPEWLITDFACMYDDMMNVGLHHDWDQPKVEQIMQDAEVDVVVTCAGFMERFVTAARDGVKITAVVLTDFGEKFMANL